MSVVLIGPPAAGKSTLGALLADALDLPFVDADDACLPLYAEVGWSAERLQALVSELGYERAHQQWEVALAHAVERLIELHPRSVIALGAGHTHPTQAELFHQVRGALSGAEAVLLRPSADVDQSVAVLRERCHLSKGHDWVRDGVDWLRRWCTDGCDERLATRVIYNADEAVDDTVRRLTAP